MQYNKEASVEHWREVGRRYKATYKDFPKKWVERYDTAHAAKSPAYAERLKKKEEERMQQAGRVSKKGEEKVATALVAAWLQKRAEEGQLSSAQKSLSRNTGLVGALPYAGGIAAPVMAGMTAPKGKGAGRVGRTLGYGMLGALPGAALAVSGMGRGSPLLRGAGMVTALAGQGLGSGFGMRQAMRKENREAMAAKGKVAAEKTSGVSAGAFVREWLQRRAS